MHNFYRIRRILSRPFLPEPGFALTFTLVLFLGYGLISASFGQELELSSGSFSGTNPSGPSITAPQALTLLRNTTGTTFVPYTPPISVSASFSNQQYTNINQSGTLLGTGTGLTFGESSDGTNKQPIADNIYLPMSGIGGGANTLYTSNPNGTAGTGIDRTVNYSFNIFTTTEPLSASTNAANGRFYYGNITLTFNRPVNDPVLHFVGMGGAVTTTTNNTTVTRGFSTELEITSPGLTLSKLSGSNELVVNPATSNASSYSIINNSSTIGAACGAGAACGSVRVTGSNITSLTFRVYLKGDGRGANYTSGSYSGDKWLLGVSLRAPSTLSGTIFDDANGLTDNVISGTATNTNSTLYANLVNSNNAVVDVVTVPSSGTYAFSGIWEGTYSVVLSTTAGTVGSVPPAASLPTNWVNTGEGVGANGAGDGTPNGIVSVVVSGTGTTNDVSNINFGIDQRPSSASATVTLATQPNPGGTATVPIATSAFAGSDPEDGTYPAGLAGRQISLSPATNGILYYNGTAVTSTTTITGFNPALVTLDPVDGVVTASFAYTIFDNALVSAPTATTVNLPFSLLTISGTIFDDGNGLTDNLISGTGTNAGGPLYVILSNAATNTVVTSTLVPATGVYSLTGLYPATYSVRLSSTSAAVGATPPAVSLPANFTSVGEGLAAGGDGTPNGITSVTLTTANLTGLNFGLDQLPIPTSSTLTAQVNPGGINAVTIPPASFTGTDADGTISSIRYTAFPSNTTSLTIGTSTYTALTFPGGGVTAVTGTTVRLDPIDGVVTVVIPFRPIDNAGQESTSTGTVSVPFTGLTIAGTVFNDANGLTDNVINGTGTNAGGGLYTQLVDALGDLIASQLLPTTGAYSFSSVSAGTYNVRLSTSAGTIGSTAPAVSLPTGWTFTGEGTAPAGDGLPDGSTQVTLTTANLTNVNFGIDQLPFATSTTLASQINPGGTNGFIVPPASFTGTDADGTIAAVRYTAFPTNINSLTIGQTVYTSATFPAGGVTATVGTNVQIDPVDGIITTSIPFRVIDNANQESTNTATVSVPFVTATISGTVLNDGNGLTDNLISGTGTNAGGPLYVILTNAATNTVVTSMLVPATGVYSLTGLYPATYSVRLSSTSAAVGTTPPAVSLPANFTSIGEGLAAGGDGTPNGITSVTLTTANLTGVNFGIDQRPSSASATVTLANQPNPGGTATVPIATSAFAGSDPEDGTYPAGLAGRQISLSPATNGILYYNGTAVTSTTTITSFNPALVTLDPVDGAVTASFAYTIFDNALVSAPTATTVNLPFSLLTISGTIFDDGNGLTDNLISGTGTNAGGPLYVIVSEATSGTVVTSTLVPATGVYSLTGLYPATYSVRLSSTSAAVGTTPPAVSLPANFTSVGEGLAVGGDGTPNGITSVTLTTTNVANVNFGLDQLPIPTSVTLAAQSNPGGTNAIIVPSTIPNGTDADGTVTRVLYTAFPTNAMSISIGGTVYTAANFPPAGVTTAVGTTLLVDPVDGAVTVSVPFRVIDNALQTSVATGTVTIPFTCLTPICPVVTGQRINPI